MHTKHAGAITIQHNGDWSGEALFIVRLESGTSVSHPVGGHDMRTIAGMIVLEQAQAMAEDLLFDQIGQEGDSLAIAQGRLHRDLQRVDRSASRLAAVLAEEGREIDSSLAQGAARSAREWIPIVAGLAESPNRTIEDLRDILADMIERFAPSTTSGEEFDLLDRACKALGRPVPPA